MGREEIQETAFDIFNGFASPIVMWRRSRDCPVTSCRLSRIHLVAGFHLSSIHAPFVAMNPVASSQPKLTPHSAVLFGIACAAASVLPILGGLGVIDMKLTPGTPRWVGVGAGGVFLLAGMMLIVDGATGAIGTDGQLSTDAPRWLHVFQSLMGIGIVATMGAIAS